MPLPLLFIGAALGTGLIGAGASTKATLDNIQASKINTQANEAVTKANELLNFQREAVSIALQQLGELKLHILSENVTKFVRLFEQIKNVDFTSSVGLEELEKFHLDKNDFEELKELGNYALEVAGGLTAGLTGGALTAIGAYQTATLFASASTGTAISTLSGAAATNATLAFFGGGSLAAGGLGVAGGMMVLGGLVAGPALLVTGLITGAKAQEKLDKALMNKAESEEIVASLMVASDKCSAIRRRTYMFYNMLSYLDAQFLPMIEKMESVLQNEGTDYRLYSEDAKKTIMASASTAGSIKSVLDTPILSEDGSLTSFSEKVLENFVFQ